MICFPNAKINIGLNIGDEQPCGLHEISSVFIPIKLSDSLEVIESSNKTSKIQINYSGLVKDIENDLCIKVYNLLDKRFNLPPVKVHLHKCIPIGSGLGGGSSNAICMLNILNLIFDLKLTQKDFLKYAKLLGSDCSFFIYNQIAHISGTGCKITKKGISRPKGVNNHDRYKLVLIVPKKLSLSTYEIFSYVRRRKKEQLFTREKEFKKLFKKVIRSNSLKLDLPDCLESYRSLVFNDLEDISFELAPLLKSIKNDLYKNGAIYASMSGSGSAIYGIYPEDVNFEKKYFKISSNYKKSDFFIWKENFEFIDCV